ncbi:MAG: hypothetical protein IJ374_08900 [Lachnospiraceae bacterium]|nr:hypothetical protein [Lachnospiraceae bacterium]
MDIKVDVSLQTKQVLSQVQMQSQSLEDMIITQLSWGRLGEQENFHRVWKSAGVSR